MFHAALLAAALTTAAALAAFATLERGALVTAARLAAPTASCARLAGGLLAGAGGVAARLCRTRRTRLIYARGVGAWLANNRRTGAWLTSDGRRTAGRCTAARLARCALGGAALVAPASSPPALARPGFAGCATGACGVVALVGALGPIVIACACRGRRRVGNVVARGHGAPTSGRPRSCAISASIASCGFALWIATAVCHDRIACARVPARRATSP